MTKISAKKAVELRGFIAKYKMKQLLRNLKKLKLFPIEREIIKNVRNHSIFLAENKLKWNSDDLESARDKESAALRNILNNFKP